MLGVLPHKMIKGCSTLEGTENLAHFQNSCQSVMDLNSMLETPFRTDAHFTSYNLIGLDMWPRLNKSILSEIRSEGSDIVLAYFTFDWDNVNHAEWTKETMDHFGNLLATCQDPIISSWSAFYTTKHGARLIYKLSVPVPVDEGEQHLSWMYHHFKKFGFDLIDDACKDWTRLMRCPKVIRDNVPTWEQAYYESLYRENILDIALVGKLNTKTVAHKTHFVKDKQEMPDHSVLESILHGINESTGKKKQTEYFKRSKRLLKDNTYVDTLFNSALPGWEKGQRNTEICKMLGIIVPILLKGANASVIQIFALAVQPLLTLDAADCDWVAHGWNALLDIYEREINLLNLEREGQAAKATAEASTLDLMVEGMRAWCNDEALQNDDEKARNYVRENCLASVMGFFYLMNEQGNYDPFAVNKDQLIARVRKTFLIDIIPTKKTSYTGESVDVSTSALQNEFSTPVSEVKMKPVGDSGGYIEHINGKRPALVLSTFSRNALLEPTHNNFVEQWLYHLFGEKHFETGCAWIGNALAFEEGLICALSLEGASNSGKKVLIEGLSECLTEPYIATPEDIYGQSSAFMHTPFLNVNETWPSGRGMASPADKFKSLTGGDGIIIDEKFKPKARILCPVRMILTANDDGIVRTLTQGKSMGIDNRIAVGERLYHVKVSNKAMFYLRSIGGRGFTARKGQRWIRPDSGTDSSDFIVAKHFLWLHANRAPVDPSQRFLVMGNCAPGSGEGGLTIIDRLLSQNNNTPVVIDALIGMVDSEGSNWNQYLRYDADLTSLWVTRNGICKYVRQIIEERLNDAEILGGMQPLLVRTEPVETDNLNWYEINMDLLAAAATEKGIAVSKVRNFVINRAERGLRYE